MNPDDPATGRRPSAPRVRPTPPEAVVELADARANARAERDWALADSLRARIEEAGWKVEDSGFSYTLLPAAPPDILDGVVALYGSAASVPSALGGPPTAAFSVILLAEAWPDDLARTLAGLRRHAPTGTHVVVVANAPARAQAARLEGGAPDIAPIGGEPVEVVRTSVRLGHAAALNVGLRRARGAIVVLAGTSVEPTGDALAPLAEALADPSVAVTGGFGTVSADMRRFLEADGPEVDAIDGCWLGFRREDIERLGPLDERFVLAANLDTWWSLTLRSGPDPDLEPRRAVRIPLPLARHAPPEDLSIPADERDRLIRRSVYRILDRFRGRSDLLIATREPALPPGPVRGAG